ncbi:tyrosine-type recombinase/integrase [Streptomyces sp. CdTB01]|uniref:site-specific integrase n=1 Tax=Streptomyces sp. CdTB01 TaxID=1725411 RepID=UPI000A56A350|nr:tyrosine-type recombinase/integrase [Streptomyces sp. CdTB01]
MLYRIGKWMNGPDASPKIVPLAVEQVRTLSEEIPARYKGLVLLGAGTGLRPGELFGLQLRHVDLLHATVSVEQQIQQTAKHGVNVCPPKTARSHRTVPLPRMAVDAMKAHLRDFPADGPEGWIFTAPQGGPVVYTHFMDGSWRPACAKAGIPKGTGPRPPAPLRQPADQARRVREDGLRAPRHTNAGMTLNAYTHLWPDSEKRSRAAVDKAYADQSADAQPQVDEAA